MIQDPKIRTVKVYLEAGVTSEGAAMDRDDVLKKVVSFFSKSEKFGQIWE